MTKIFSIKKIGIAISILILISVGAFLLFQNDVPITQANVNTKPLGNLELKRDILTNFWGDTQEGESGFLVVPENREDTINTNRIEIFFHRLKSTNPNPGSPILFLAGGPGSSGYDIGRTKYFYLFKELRNHADVVLIDQRGTGNSIPNLNCRNNLKLPTDITENVWEGIYNDLEKKIGDCADEFREMGIRLEYYTSKESAMDVEALRVALGYDKISLYGYSYGTELAQFYIDHFEQNVDKVIMAGPVAPDQGLKLPHEVDRQFQNMDSLILKDKRLSKYVPSFTKLMKEVHQDLKSDPVLIEIPLEDALDDDAPLIQKMAVGIVSATKPNWEMMLTDPHLQMIASNNIGSDRWITRFPEFYYQISKGNYRDVGNMLRNLRRKRLPNALFFTVNGATGYSEERRKLASLQGERSSLSDIGISFGRSPSVMAAFGVKKQTGLNDPVSSDVHTLLIGGTLDGRTPMSNLDSIANRFPNHRKIIIENAGHNDLIDEEIMVHMISFLNDSLYTDVSIQREIRFLNPVPYQYSISDTLNHTMENAGIEETIRFYKELEVEYGAIADYIFNFEEEPLNNLAYELMYDHQVNDAIMVLKLAIEKFPNSYNLYNSISEAYQLLGDDKNEELNLKKAIELNYFDAYSQTLLAELKRRTK